MKQPCISIVIPAYNEEKNIPYIYEELLKVFETLSASYEFEIIFVDDGSEDMTWSHIESLAEMDARVKGVHFSRNFGKELAITAGLEYATGEAVITLDADGQHPVEKIPLFLSTWKEGFDIVYNRRPEAAGISLWKKCSSWCFYKFFNFVSRFQLEPGATDYRLLDRQVVRAYLGFSEKNRIYRGLIDWLGFKKKAIVFDAKNRKHGVPTFSNRQLFQLALDSITSFSFFPLKFVGYMGFCIVVLGIGTLFVQVIDRLGYTNFGFTNLGIVVVINTIMMGCVLMSLGLVGIYIARIHDEVIGRPLYVVKSKRNIP